VLGEIRSKREKESLGDINVIHKIKDIRDGKNK
jgi:hypothetical protein